MNIIAITLVFIIGFLGGMAAMALLLEKALQVYKEERLGK